MATPTSNFHYTFIAFLSWLLTAPLWASAEEALPEAPETSAPLQSLRWWSDAKFGLFIHWGPVSLTGEEISWSRGGERPGLPHIREGEIPLPEYDRLYRQFNPVQFDAEEWVNIAKAAGMKYMVFTTKHHDGFCMFDSQLTEYDIAQSPYRKDIVAELARACHDGGLGLGLYYSLPDWHHPDYKTDTHTGYVDYLHGQLRELCTNYGRVDIVWFDGKRQGTAETWGARNLVRTIRELQPHALINDRIWFAADFETPEQVVGRFQPGRAWESCITLGHQWAWKPDDLIKPAEECIRLLVRCVGGGGNMMLNVGPMPSGAIEPRQVERLKEIGDWLRQYGESIYGTNPGPFPPSFWGASTHRDDLIYVHIFPGWGSKLKLPPIERKVVSGRLLHGESVEVEQSANGLVIDIPPPNEQSPVSVVVLHLDGAAEDIPPKSNGMGMPKNVVARASNIRRGETNYAAVGAVDESPLSRWATDDGITEAWLEFHLPEPITFDVMMIDEAFGPRVEEFRLQAKENGEWKTFYTGTKIDRNWAGRFPPVTAQDLRFEILKASDGPTFRDIQFHYVESAP